MRNKWHVWREREDALIRELAQTHTPAQIGKRLERTARSVQTRASFLNVSLRCKTQTYEHVTFKLIKEAVCVFKESKNKTEAAKKLNVKFGRLAYLLKLAEKEGLL